MARRCGSLSNRDGLAGRSYVPTKLVGPLSPVVDSRSPPLEPISSNASIGGPGCLGPAARSRLPITRGILVRASLFPSCTPPIMELPQARTSTTTVGAQDAPRLSSPFRVPPAAGLPRPAADGHVGSNQGLARRFRLVRRHSERENPSPLSSSRWPRLPAPVANDGPLPCSPIRRPPGRF